MAVKQQERGEVEVSRLPSRSMSATATVAFARKADVEALLLHYWQQITTPAFGKHKHAFKQRQYAPQRIQRTGYTVWKLVGRFLSGGLLMDIMALHYLSTLARLDLLVSHNASTLYTVNIYNHATDGEF